MKEADEETLKANTKDQTVKVSNLRSKFQTKSWGSESNRTFFDFLSRPNKVFGVKSLSIVCLTLFLILFSATVDSGFDANGFNNAVVSTVGNETLNTNLGKNVALLVSNESSVSTSSTVKASVESGSSTTTSSTDTTTTVQSGPNLGTQSSLNPSTTTTTTSLPQSQIDSTALQIYTDNQNLIKTSEAYDQLKLKLKFEQLAIDFKYQKVRDQAIAVNDAKANLRQAAIQGAILELSGDNSGLQGLSGIASLNSEIKNQFSTIVVKNLFAKMRAYQNLLQHENNQLVNLNSLRTADSLTLLSLSAEQTQAIQQVSKDQALLDSAGSSIGAILTLVQQYQFGNFLTPQESQQITAFEQTISTQKNPPTSATPNEMAVFYAEQKLGLPYIWGGAGPFGYDCSGLTMSAWGQAGVGLIHSAAIQYQEVDHIPLWDLQPGDLLFYDFSGNDNPANIDHVVMYIGNNMVIQAAYTGTNIMISPIWSNDLVGAGRPAYPNMPPPPAPNASPPANFLAPTFSQ